MRSDKRLKKKYKTLTRLMLIMTGLVVISLLVTSFFMIEYIKKREDEIIRQKIYATAKVVANDNRVKDDIKHHRKTLAIQKFANRVMEETGTDFVVITDETFTRYSHPINEFVGKNFSNIEDISSTFHSGDHYSKQSGVLGDGLRFFTAIKDDDGNNIGVVCVGYTKETVKKQILHSQEKILFGLLIGIVVAITLAIVYNNRLKRILLNYEPEEIAYNYIEKNLISDHVSEGIIAINMNKKVIVKNSSANQILDKAGYSKVKKGEQIPDKLFEIFFRDIIEENQTSRDELIVLNHIEVLVNRNAIYQNGKLYGGVVTLRDQSEMKKLITELSGTEKYNDSLREQSHHFMNKLHVLHGLIEMKSYDEVEKYISYLKDDYHEKIGYISESIKVPAIAGFLLAKVREAKQKNISLLIDPDSRIINKEGLDELYNELLIILGVLIDNSMESIADNEEGKIVVYLYLNTDENILLCQVYDNGCGISKDILENVFERGYSTKGENRGYGLNAVDTIVKKYNGLIDVESEVSKTKFTIEIPIKEEQ
ncbi:ATPase/histidine kinase/DNA gyrase B/HSP90 domain protein [Gemella haemolysans]|uniref:histidine kinase n=2 Tax=Gemella haemolysans TaxID=1379 RepID=A0A133ZS83_9BACL|nr:ATPase/histidine kinase/DNA gyrase B/HSP90 domain protein [Gemella haemolysans]